MAIDNRKSLRGYLYIAAATFCWGVSATLGRAAFTGRLLPGGQALRPIDPLILSQSRVTFSFVVFLLVLLWRRGWHRLQLPAADFGRLFLLGIFGVAASNYFYYLAIQRTNVATAIVVQYTAPLWVLLYMVARRAQRATLLRIVAVVLAITGIALVIGIVSASGIRLDLVGVVAALTASVSFAVYNIGGHSVLARYDHWIVLLYITFSASLFWMVLDPPWKVMAARYSGEQWVFLLIFSLVSMLAPFSFYIAGLRYLDPTRAIVVSCLEPVFSIVIAAIALGELVRPMQIAGIVLVLAAIVMVQMPDKVREQEATLLEPID